MAAARASSAADAPRRIRVALSCSVCGNRNYRTTKRSREGTSINLKKFCSHCNQHTVHIEGK
jgi:large subunit ribosomal protein L33